MPLPHRTVSARARTPKREKTTTRRVEQAYNGRLLERGWNAAPARNSRRRRKNFQENKPLLGSIDALLYFSYQDGPPRDDILDLSAKLLLRCTSGAFINADGSSTPFDAHNTS